MKLSFKIKKVQFTNKMYLMKKWVDFCNQISQLIFSQKKQEIDYQSTENHYLTNTVFNYLFIETKIFNISCVWPIKKTIRKKSSLTNKFYYSFNKKKLKVCKKKEKKLHKFRAFSHLNISFCNFLMKDSSKLFWMSVTPYCCDILRWVM